jgi:hypothetical protein
MNEQVFRLREAGGPGGDGSWVELEDVTDPNIVYNLRAKLDATGFYDDFEVERVAEVEVNPKAKQGGLVAALSPVADRLRLAEIIERVNGLFEGELTDDDQLVYVNDVIKKKMLESEELTTRATNNTKAQFAASPTLSTELMNAIMDTLAAHTTMSKQALESERVRDDILLGPGQLYEALRERRGAAPG